jgi:hypothetical protein
MKTNRILIVILLAVLGIPVFRATADGVDGVTVKDGDVYSLQGGKLTPLTESLDLPFDVEVNTNGTFKVGKDGKDRQIQEGQVVRNDGWMLNPNGAIQPVFDHVVMTKGQVYVVKDGQSTALDKTMVFPNGMSVDPQGYGSNLPGGVKRLVDGQLFRLDGTPIQAKDTVSLKNGQVVVQKNGSLIPLQSVQVMGMDDGSRIYGSGLIEKRDGQQIKLREGQTILLDGANYGR